MVEVGCVLSKSRPVIAREMQDVPMSRDYDDSHKEEQTQ